MSLRIACALVALIATCGICNADDRWTNFAEDADLRYYLDQKSVTNLPDNVHVVWIKSIAKDRNYYKAEYNLNNLAYILTNYEIDCAVSSYRVRGVIMFDKNRKEITKVLPSGGEPALEPIPPESMLELAQSEVCTKAASEEDEKEQEPAPSQPVELTPPAEPALPAEPAPQAEPPTMQ
jgi:hypothetical protein